MFKMNSSYFSFISGTLTAAFLTQIFEVAKNTDNYLLFISSIFMLISAIFMFVLHNAHYPIKISYDYQIKRISITKKSEKTIWKEVNLKKGYKLYVLLSISLITLCISITTYILSL